jgi:hypothetical protein
MHYKNPDAIPVVAKLGGIEFKATITEERANKLFGGLDCFDGLKSFVSYLEEDLVYNIGVEFSVPEGEVVETEIDEVLSAEVDPALP